MHSVLQVDAHDVQPTHSSLQESLHPEPHVSEHLFSQPPEQSVEHVPAQLSMHPPKHVDEHDEHVSLHVPAHASPQPFTH